jgi:hypothetical protein
MHVGFWWGNLREIYSWKINLNDYSRGINRGVEKTT